MSDERTDNTIEQLAKQIIDQVSAMRRAMTSHAEALLGINALISSHTKTLRMHQAVIERVASELGIAFDGTEPPDAQNPPPLN